MTIGELRERYRVLGGHEDLAEFWADIERLLSQGKTLNDYAAESRADNDRWWHDPTTGEPLVGRNKGELIALMHSELSEALEAVRKDLMDDKVPHRRGEEVELADCLIRIFDYAGHWHLDLEGAYQDKRAFNRTRPDHSDAARSVLGGKKF